MKKTVILFLCAVLVLSCFSACGKPGTEDKVPATGGDVLENTEATNNGTVNNNDEQNKTPWIVDAMKTGTYISALPFCEDLAFVCIDNTQYFIDKIGNLRITLEDWHMTDLTMKECRFYNGLFYVDNISANGVESYFIDKDGKEITAQDMGGTALYESKIFYELLEAGYIVVDKVTSSFDGAKCESAIYNTKLEQVQPYSTKLYELFHWDEPFTQGLSFYDGYVYYKTSRKLNYLESESYVQTYHIVTNTFAEYDSFPLTYVNKLDDAFFSIPVGSVKGMHRDGEMLLDLSQYTTLQNVEYCGDLGIAIFRNEEGKSYFTIMDTEGNLKFDPVLYSQKVRYVNDFCEFNGNIILTCENVGQQQDGSHIYQVKTFDLEGKEMGCVELYKQDETFISIMLGEDTIVIDNCYYDKKLVPLFPIE